MNVKLLKFNVFVEGENGRFLVHCTTFVGGRNGGLGLPLPGSCGVSVSNGRMIGKKSAYIIDHEATDDERKAILNLLEKHLFPANESNANEPTRTP